MRFTKPWFLVRRFEKNSLQKKFKSDLFTECFLTDFVYFRLDKMFINNISDHQMIPVGYMYKIIEVKPDWLKNNLVSDVYSVSGCISEDFDDWVNYWKHNGYWFFNSPTFIEDIAKENNINLERMKLFFYKVYEFQWSDEENIWEKFEPEASFETNVKIPQKSVQEGFDVTSYSAEQCAECSPLSCNLMAEELEVNEHCLLDSLTCFPSSCLGEQDGAPAPNSFNLKTK
ncbi:hypothetical protein GYB29_04145 [bacterium]|nr:hypothetical protein [bacterium]